MYERIKQFVSILRKAPGCLGRLREDEIFGDDAHSHTDHSDGMSLPYLILLHRRYGFRKMAVTDHDFITLKKNSLRMRYVRSLAYLAGVEVYPGAELSCRLLAGDLGLEKETLSLHITGLDISPDTLPMREMLDALAEGREAHAAGMLDRIRHYRPDLVMPEKINKRYGVKTSTDIALEICRLNPGEDLGEFLHTLITDKAYRMPWKKADAAVAIAAIKASGGFAVWAHPVKTLRGDFVHFEKVALRLVELGIGGIEAFARGQTLEQTIRIIRFCTAHGLRICGGADTHWERHLTDYVEMIKEYSESMELMCELENYRQVRRTCLLFLKDSPFVLHVGKQNLVFLHIQTHSALQAPLSRGE